MKLIKSNALWLAATLLGCSEVFTVIQAVDTKPNEDGFISIFDGKTLNGWEATPAKSAKAWEVKSGTIIGTGDNGRGYLTYSKNKKIADLELKFSYRFPGKGNKLDDVWKKCDLGGFSRKRSFLKGNV